MKSSTVHLTMAGFTLLLSACQDNKGKTEAQQTQPPNIIILFTDDQGYADLNSFGGEIPTPSLDLMAREGMKFTDFYVPSPSCAPSRSALITGCYPARNYVSPDKPGDAIDNIVSMKAIDMDELAPIDQKFVKDILKKQPHAKLARHSWGLPDSEVTIPEMLKTVGYSTVMYGKWHLGEYHRQLPTNHGFDEYYGVPQSVSVRAPHDHTPWMVSNQVFFPNQPFYMNDSIVSYQSDSSLLTKEYTEKAIKYIKDHKSAPFFMYLAYAMPHVPIGASERFSGKSTVGLYGDVITEIDWSVGEILKALKKEGISENSLVIFTSDNGPWLAYGNHAGSAKPLREGKGTQFEGGVRVPAIMWWPGEIPAGTCNKNPAMTIDFLPTFAEIAGADLPDHPIDGKSILPMFRYPESKSPQEAYYFFSVGNIPNYEGLVALRMDDWKLFFPHTYKTAENKPMGKDGVPVNLDTDSIGWALFNLREDIGERNNVAGKHPELLEELKKQGLEFKEKIEASQRGVVWITKTELINKK